MAAGSPSVYDVNNYYRILEDPISGMFYFRYKTFIFFWKTYPVKYNSLQDVKNALNAYKEKVETRTTLFKCHIIHTI
jgi:hypothetical protein